MKLNGVCAYIDKWIDGLIVYKVMCKKYNYVSFVNTRYTLKNGAIIPGYIPKDKVW